MNRTRTTYILIVAALTFLIAPLPAATAQSDGWDWSFGIYGWLPDLNLKGDVSESISRKDLLSKVEFVFAGHIEGRRGKFGLLADAMYLDMEGSGSFEDSQLPQGTTIDLEVEQLLLELGGFYRPSGGSEGFDVLFGARLVSLENDVLVDNPNAPGIVLPIVKTTKNDLWDGFLGLRYTGSFSDRWGYSLRGDVATGGTDLTWNGVGSLDWKWGANRQHGVLAGWRYMQMDLDNDADAVVKKVTFTGPFLAAVFGF